MLRCSSSIVLLALGLPPGAQSTLRFEPADLRAEVLELRFVRDGVPAEARAWPSGAPGWLFVRREGTQMNLDTLPPGPADERVLRIELGGSGPALVGWDPAPRVEQARVSELRAFLAERAGGKALPRELESLGPSATVALARLESLALVGRELGGAIAPAAVAASKSGQRVELRPVLDPSALPAGSDFPFKLYLPEGGAENVYCRAVQLESRAAHALERLPDGSLRARLEQPGPWMIEVQRLRALDGGAGAALELASGTLVFVVPPAPSKEGR